MKDWNRREFLAASALAAAAQDPPPARPRGREGSDRRPSQPEPARVAANEKVVLGFIGTGGMGTGLINIFKNFSDVQIAAVCDVYEPHRNRAQSEAGGKPDAYGDCRKVLDRRDLDAVVIATPDHWPASI